MMTGGRETYAVRVRFQRVTTSCSLSRTVRQTRVRRDDPGFGRGLVVLLHGFHCGRGHVRNGVAPLVGYLRVAAAAVFALTWLAHASLLANTTTLSAGDLHVGRL